MDALAVQLEDNLHGQGPIHQLAHRFAFIRIPEECLLGFVLKTSCTGALASLRMLLSWGFYWVCNLLPRIVSFILPRPFIAIRMGRGPPFWYYCVMLCS